MSNRLTYWLCTLQFFGFAIVALGIWLVMSRAHARNVAELQQTIVELNQQIHKLQAAPKELDTRTNDSTRQKMSLLPYRADASRPHVAALNEANQQISQSQFEIRERQIKRATGERQEPAGPKENEVRAVRSIDEMLTFFPAKYPDGHWNPVGLPFEDCWFEADDGVTLHGWYCECPNARAVVLFAHGNAGNLSHRAPVLQLLRDRFLFSVMIFDYRGYGRSEGSPTVDGVLRDARAARDFLARREGVRTTEIVLMGRSLGGGVMVDLAARDGARALILESTFTSLNDVAKSHYPSLLVKLVMPRRLDSLSKIENYTGPLLQSHGDADSIISHSIGKQLFQAANEPKTFVTLAGADHNDPQTEDYYQALDKFIAALPPAR